MTALEAFRLIAPGFSAMSDDAVSSYITLAASFLDKGCLDDEKWSLAQALMAAHLVSMADRAASSSAAGPITSETEGDLSRSYGRGADNSTWLGLSNYGEMLDSLLKECRGLNIMTRFG